MPRLVYPFSPSATFVVDGRTLNRLHEIAARIAEDRIAVYEVRRELLQIVVETAHATEAIHARGIQNHD